MDALDSIAHQTLYRKNSLIQHLKVSPEKYHHQSRLTSPDHGALTTPWRLYRTRLRATKFWISCLYVERDAC